MAQGSGKLGKAKKSAGAQKRKTVKAKSVLTKGRKQFQTKKKSDDPAGDDLHNKTKTINRTIERLVASKAVSAGSHFFLNDLVESGTQEMQRQLKERDKKQAKSSRGISDRLKDQLHKLGKSA